MKNIPRAPAKLDDLSLKQSYSRISQRCFTIMEIYIPATAENAFDYKRFAVSHRSYILTLFNQKVIFAENICFDLTFVLLF